MTKSPVRIIIAVLLIIVLIKMLFGMFIDFIHGAIDLSSGEAIGETMGRMVAYAIVGLVIFFLLKEKRKKAE